MKTLFLAAAAAAAAISMAAPAQAAPAAGAFTALYTPADRPQLDTVQYLYGGRNYCWYDGGWRGPGYYWCGYSGRRGFGWGGPLGWNGWVLGGYRGHARYGSHRYYGAGFREHRSYHGGGGRGGSHGGGHGGGHSGGHSGGHGGGHHH